jgi:lysophospholipase L1-like esterase
MSSGAAVPGSARSDRDVPPSWLLLYYGDSLGMPRPQEGVEVGETLPDRCLDALRSAPELQGVHVQLWNRSQAWQHARGLADLVQQDVAHLEGSDVRVIAVVAIGIVDAAPRPIPYWLRQAIEKMRPSIRWRVRSVIHAMRPVTQRMGIRFYVTSQKAFGRLIPRCLATVGPMAEGAIVVGISPTTPANDRRSPGLSRSIERYGKLLERSATAAGFRFLEPPHETPAGDRGVLLPDGIHLSPEGNEILAAELAAECRAIIVGAAPR